ncbi:TPA: hypothetical protein ACPSKB_000679 [Legionella feeleii]
MKKQGSKETSEFFTCSSKNIYNGRNDNNLIKKTSNLLEPKTMKLVSIFLGILITCSANALTLEISYPEGIPEGAVTVSNNLTIKNSAGSYSNISSSATYKKADIGLSYFSEELRAYQPVIDNNESHNIIKITLRGQNNTCTIRQLHKYRLIRLELFKDGHCALI